MKTCEKCGSPRPEKGRCARCCAITAWKNGIRKNHPDDDGFKSLFEAPVGPWRPGYCQMCGKELPEKKNKRRTGGLPRKVCYDKECIRRRDAAIDSASRERRRKRRRCEFCLEPIV